MADLPSDAPRLDLLPRPKGPADTQAAEAAIHAFLQALGFDLAHPALKDTPRRVTEAYTQSLLRGYAEHPETAIGQGFAVDQPTMVRVQKLPLLFVCPHHLMPAKGEVNLAFWPSSRVPGLSRIGRLIDCLSRRLLLQEELTEAIAKALSTALDLEAVAVEITAEHGCVALEDLARAHTQFVTRSGLGDPTKLADLYLSLARPSGS